MNTELLCSGIFTISEAARLLNVGPRRLRTWVASAHGSPIIRGTIPSIDHRIAISFINLIEAHFIDAFSRFGLHLNSIRAMAREAQRFLKTPHPFATEVMFRTDRQKIFASMVLNETDDPKLYDLKGKNWALPPIVEEALEREMLYGPTGFAAAWYPRKTEAPNVVVNPKIAFGQPALHQYGVPTRTISEAVAASNGDVDSIARWYEIPKRHVEEAVRFERQLIVLH